MPYITQKTREGLRELVDSQVAGLRAACEQKEVLEKRDSIVEEDLYLLLQLRKRDSDGADVLPISKLVDELVDRQKGGAQIGGCLNFCVCRYLVMLTEIHKSPSYEAKIQWIQERLEGVRLRLAGSTGSVFDMFNRPTFELGIITCVQLELYRRFAISYENEKLKLNGDITD